MSKPNLAVAIDAGSHSLKGLVLDLSKVHTRNSRPSIIKKKFVKLPISYGEQPFSEYQAKTASKLGEFILEMTKEGLRNSDKITVGLGPGFTDVSVEKYSIKLTGKERVLTTESAGKYFKNLGNTIDAVILDIWANGYLLPKLKEVKLPDVCELNFKALTSKFTKDASVVMEETKRSLSGLSLEFLPNSYFQQIVLTEVFKVKDVLAIDMGGENTQVSFLKSGSLAKNYSFPLGARHFIRGVTKISGLIYDEAEDLKRQYAQNLLDESRKKQVQSFLVEESWNWYKMFTEGVGGFCNLGILPSQVFLFGGGANLREVADVVRTGEWLKGGSAAEYPKVNILGGESVFEGDTFDGYLHGPEDFNLASMVFYIMELWK